MVPECQDHCVGSGVYVAGSGWVLYEVQNRRRYISVDAARAARRPTKFTDICNAGWYY